MDDKKDHSEISANITAVSSSDNIRAVSSSDITAVSSTDNIRAVSSSDITAVSSSDIITAVSFVPTVTADSFLYKMSSFCHSDLTSQSSCDITNTGYLLPVLSSHDTRIKQLEQKIANMPRSGNVQVGDHNTIITKTDERASNMKESTRSVLNSVDRRVYVETRAEKRGVELLKKHGVVIVVGCPGSGKTTLALSMMREIEIEEKRESYSLTHHYEFNDISLSENKKCVVLIDDIFGKTNLVSDFTDSWKLKFPKLWNLVQDGSLKCIITLRKQIFSESEISLKEFDLFNEKHVLDLQSDDCCLTYDEKENILKIYFQQKDVPLVEFDKKAAIYSSCRELGFPQVCVYYVNSIDAQKRGVEYFRKPVEYLTQQLENLKKNKTLQINYLVLLLILFKEGSMSIDSLDPSENDTDSDIMKLVRKLERFCQSVKNTDLTDIKETADAMCGTYLKCCDNKYTFIHQSVFESLFLIFSSKFPKKAAELLEVCPVTMLLEYVVTPGVSNKSHITMTVRPDCFDVLARRFTDLLASDNFREIVSHPSLKDEGFLKFLTEDKNIYDKLSEILVQRLNEYQIKYYYISLVHVHTVYEILTNISCLLDNDSKFQSSDIWNVKVEENFVISSSVPSECVVKGLRTLSKFFTSNLCKMDVTCLKKELLDISCLFGDEDVVKMLLESGVTPTFDTFSAAACSKTDSATILKELLQYEKDMKLSQYSHLLHISICSGNMSIACLLVDMINNKKDNSEIKEEAVKLLLVRFHRKVRLASSKMHMENSFKTVDVSHLFKKLVTIDIINKIKDIAIDAAYQSNSNVIKEIVRLKPDCINDENRDKVLLAAAMWGSTDTVNFLIEQRCNDTDENSWKKGEVLKVAVVFNSVDVVQCLLDKGADPNVNVAVNKKLIQLFEEETRLKLLLQEKLSLKLLPSDSPLHISVLRGDLDMIKSLIKRKADVNAVNSEGKTVLHEAVEAVTHRKEVALLLLENGADVNITDKQNNSALHIASQIDVDVVKEVTKKSVEINVINTKGETPLFMSIYYNRPEIALYLLKQGADPNLTDNDSNSVLHLAAKHGNVEIVTALIEKGIDVNIRNCDGKTPLFSAVEYKHNKVVLYLLEHGADPNLTDSDSNSVLHLAAEDRNLEIVTTLIEKRADVNIKNIKGETPLFTAFNYWKVKYLNSFTSLYIERIL